MFAYIFFGLVSLGIGIKGMFQGDYETTIVGIIGFVLFAIIGTEVNLKRENKSLWDLFKKKRK